MNVLGHDSLIHTSHADIPKDKPSLPYRVGEPKEDAKEWDQLETLSNDTKGSVLGLGERKEHVRNCFDNLREQHHWRNTKLPIRPRLLPFLP